MATKLSDMEWAEVSRLLDSEKALDYEIDYSVPDAGAEPPPPLSAADAAEADRLSKVTDR